MNNNNGNGPPIPPERTSSYNMYQTGPAAAAVSSKKTVSFHADNRQVLSGELDDDVNTPDRQSSLLNSAPPTPGVVGSQELYLDPRERIQAGRTQPPSNYQTPERMSFRDKMRRFAAEAGEDTPVEKSKISRAQQRIEMPAGRQ